MWCTPFETRKSCCVNARDLPTAAYQVLHVLSCPGGGGGGLPLLGGWGYPHPDLAGVPSPQWTWPGYPPSDLATVPLSDLAGVPPSRCGQTENITFPHPSDAVGKKFTFFHWCWLLLLHNHIFFTFMHPYLTSSKLHTNLCSSNVTDKCAVLLSSGKELLGKDIVSLSAMHSNFCTLSNFRIIPLSNNTGRLQVKILTVLLGLSSLI